MRAIQLQAFGQNGLAFADLPVPTPGPGEVLVRVDAAALNHRDLEIVEGRYAMPVTLPLVPVSDAVGEVVECGPGVTQWHAGDRVNPVFFPDWQDGPFHADHFLRQRGAGIDGMLREYTVHAEDELVRAPHHLGLEAATLPIAALTAWRALRDAGLRPGQRVLVIGLGGVSLFALQLAKVFGAAAWVVTRGEDKVQRARSLGADLVIDRGEHPQWGQRVHEQSGGLGADLVIEVGGAATMAQSTLALAVGGTMAIVGYLGGADVSVNLKQLFIAKRARLQGHTVGSRRDFTEMNEALTLHGIRPVIDSCHDLDHVSAAFSRLASGRAVGKVLIRLR